jgi:hypothetical protein
MALTTTNIDTVTPRGGGNSVAVVVVGSSFGVVPGTVIFDPLSEHGAPIAAAVTLWQDDRIEYTTPAALIAVGRDNRFYTVAIERADSTDAVTHPWWAPSDTLTLDAVPTSLDLDYQWPSAEAGTAAQNADDPRLVQAADFNRMLDRALITPVAPPAASLTTLSCMFKFRFGGLDTGFPAGQVIPNGVPTIIDWPDDHPLGFQNGVWYNGATPGRIFIPPNAPSPSRVHFGFFLRWSPNAFGVNRYIQVDLYDSSDVIKDVIFARRLPSEISSGPNPTPQLCSGVFQCVPGDYIQAFVVHDRGLDLPISGANSSGGYTTAWAYIPAGG